MSLTLAQAAAACGIDKSTVRRAVRSGRISGTRDDLGVWHIEAVELHRIFPPLPRPADGPGALPLHAPGEITDRTSDVLVAELRAVIADLRQDRDAWRDQAQRLSLAKPELEPAVSWWRWLRSTG
jgi:hypothetical protein